MTPCQAGQVSTWRAGPVSAGRMAPCVRTCRPANGPRSAATARGPRWVRYPLATAHAASAARLQALHGASARG